MSSVEGGEIFMALWIVFGMITVFFPFVGIPLLLMLIASIFVPAKWFFKEN